MKNEAVVGSAALKTAEEEVFHVGASAATLEQGSMNDICGYDATGETNAMEKSMSDSGATNVAKADSKTSVCNAGDEKGTELMKANEKPEIGLSNNAEMSESVAEGMKHALTAEQRVKVVAEARPKLEERIKQYRNLADEENIIDSYVLHHTDTDQLNAVLDMAVSGGSVLPSVMTAPSKLLAHALRMYGSHATIIEVIFLMLCDGLRSMLDNYELNGVAQNIPDEWPTTPMGSPFACSFDPMCWVDLIHYMPAELKKEICWGMLRYRQGDEDLVKNPDLKKLCKLYQYSYWLFNESQIDEHLGDAIELFKEFQGDSPVFNK